MAPRRDTAAERRRLLTMALGRARPAAHPVPQGRGRSPRPFSQMPGSRFAGWWAPGRPADPTRSDLARAARWWGTVRPRPRLAVPPRSRRVARYHRSAGLPRRRPAPLVGVADWSIGPVPLRRPDRPLSCPPVAWPCWMNALRWLLQREARGDRTTSPAADGPWCTGRRSGPRAGHGSPCAGGSVVSPSGYDASW